VRLVVLSQAARVKVVMRLLGYAGRWRCVHKYGCDDRTTDVSRVAPSLAGTRATMEEMAKAMMAMATTLLTPSVRAEPMTTA